MEKKMTGMASPLYLHFPGCRKHRVKGMGRGKSQMSYFGVTVRYRVIKPAEPKAACPDGGVQITVESSKNIFLLN